MKKLLSKSSIAFLTVVIAVGFFAFTNEGNAQTGGESIVDYVTDITINQDSSLAVVETIDYDFGITQRHGIFRSIPYKYKARGGTFKLRIADIAVTDGEGNDLPFEKSKSGNDIVLKIGDADKTITGRHVYKISYSVRRAVNYFDDHDELYWNAVGNDWEVSVAKAQAIVRAPAAVSQMACFTGVRDSDEKNCAIAGGNTEVVTFTSTQPLEAGEGLTVVAGLPAGTLTQPTTQQKIWDIFLDNGILLLPLFVFLAMLYLWNRYGKDAKRKNSIVAQYEAPDNMSALYVGTLLHDGTKNRDIAAEVIYLAAHGFISIKRVETKKLLMFKGEDYEFTKLGKSPDGLAPQTRKLLNILFKGNETISRLSDLKTDTTFGTALMKLKADTLKELVKSGHYKTNPSTAVGLWVVAGIVLGAGAAVLSGIFIGYLGVIASVVSGLIIFVFAFYMGARTQKGADTVALIQGLEEYLTVAEKDRLKFHNAPEKNPEQFEKLLPFAIALGVEAAWAAQFKDLTKAPSWYSDATGSAASFNAGMFAGSMTHFSDSVKSTASSATTASSGGSGFSGGGSGGGGGGGGGGSW